jgi:Putative peptidoglycan binding domain
MMKLTTAACALALGIAWVAAPAIAQETTKEKAEKKADKIEQKGEQKAEETKAKAEEKADKVRSKAAEGKSDTVGGKMENAWDKTKAKTKEMKDKVVGKSGADRAGANGDVRSAQMALKEKGFDPGPIDGVMGPRTKAAVKEFQQKENLTATGQLDADTRSHLIVSAPAASPAAEPKEKKQSQ